MSIVIQNLIDQINLKVAGADSNTSTNDLIRLSELEDRIAGSINQGAVQYRSFNQLPATGDSSYGGQIAYVTDEQLDSNGRFYFKTKGGWLNLSSVSDLSEDSDITNFVFTEGGAPAGPGIAFAQGETEAFTFGGVPYKTDINRYSFTTDGNATDVGDLAQTYGFVASSSDTNGGNAYILIGTPSTSNTNRTQKFSYATGTNSVGILVTEIVNTGYWGWGSSNQVDNYRFAMTIPSHPSPFVPDGGYSGGIEKFPIANEDAYSVVELTFTSPTGYVGCGQSVYSPTNTYNFGGSSYTNTIERFPMASEDVITDVGNLTGSYRGTGAATSDTHGYGHGGTLSNGVNQNVIQKWSLSTDEDATDVGDLTNTHRITSGSSSTTYGYRHGGYSTDNTIDKWSFSVDGNATDVGDLAVAGGAMGSGQH